MTNLNLTILSYHKFVEEPSDYRFSRTYSQFWHDIRKKIFDLITIDDGMKCQIQACDMLRAMNIRAKLFVCTSLVGTEGYCTWEELKALSWWHDIENHGQIHKDHSLATYSLVYESVYTAQQKITDEIGRAPRFFVPPYNQYNGNVKEVCNKLNLQLLTDRETILNISK